MGSAWKALEDVHVGDLLDEDLTVPPAFRRGADRLFRRLDLYHGSPDFGERQCNSMICERWFDPSLRAGGKYSMSKLLGIQPRVKSLPSSYTGLYRQKTPHPEWLRRSRSSMSSRSWVSFIRTSIADEYSGLIKITTHPDHVFHCKTTSGSNRLKRWSSQYFSIDARRN